MRQVYLDPKWLNIEAKHAVSKADNKWAVSSRTGMACSDCSLHFDDSELPFNNAAQVTENIYVCSFSHREYAWEGVGLMVHLVIERWGRFVEEHL